MRGGAGGVALSWLEVRCEANIKCWCRRPLLVLQARSHLLPCLPHSYMSIQAHATAMFKRSMEVQTGSITWTKGELLGEGAFGKVRGRATLP